MIKNKLWLVSLLISSLLPIDSIAAQYNPEKEIKNHVAKQHVNLSHALSIWGDVKYPADFSHFDYADPKAPKGGKITLAARGTFDSLNPFVLKGSSARGVSLTYDSLMVRSSDEPFSNYGLVAESIEEPNDKSWVIFNLRKEARFHDGAPLTADDVIFTFNILKVKGRPTYRRYYANIVSAEKLSPHRVKFIFDQANNAELASILADLVVLPAHYWQDRDFTKSTLEPLLGSGPYRIANVDQGRTITYERVDDYWAKDLPVNRGMYNFDKVRYIYFRDNAVRFEAFKSGNFDFFNELNSRKWRDGYDFPAANDGRVKRRELKDLSPSAMQGFTFNTRRDKFKDRKVRRALSYVWDFEWTNTKLSTGVMERITSYFDNSELASSGLPSGQELAILEPYRDQLPAEIFSKEFVLPSTDGSGYNRTNLRKAMTLLNQAGWHLAGDRLVNGNGKLFDIEFLVYSLQAEGNLAAFIKNLNKLGIVGHIRLVDIAQYINRLKNYDFDIITSIWAQSLSPGNEQRYYWGTEAGQQPGSRNYAGINDRVVDALIEQLVKAKDRETLIATTHALDRALLWGFYTIPQWHYPWHRVAYWDHFGHPELVDLNITFPYRALQTWWYAPNKQQNKNEVTTR